MEKGLLKVSIQGITVSLLIKVPPALGRGQFQIIVLLGPSACRSSPFTNLKIEIVRSVMNCRFTAPKSRFQLKCFFLQSALNYLLDVDYNGMISIL